MEHLTALEALKKVREDINWMLNSRELLNSFVFNYLDKAIEEERSKEIVGWQYLYEDGKWCTGSEHNNHLKNTIDAGYKVRYLTVFEDA